MNALSSVRFVGSVRNAARNSSIGRHLPRVTLLILCALLCMAAVLATLSSPVASASPPHGFNRNHRADLAVGVPHEHLSTTEDVGAVHVLYGGLTGGLSTAGNKFWTQDPANILGDAEANDLFGSSLAIGDFNGDGYFDLAVGIPDEHVGLLADAGAIQILYGSASGLVAVGNQLWTQNSSGVGGAAEADDNFGNALAVGDFDGDSYDDLAIGVPHEDTGPTDDGAVNILYGSPAGLTGTGSQMWYQGHDAVVGIAENDDDFGRTLAAGDFNGDGKDDLAVGIPYEDDSAGDCGAAIILYGGSSGLSGAGSKIISQATYGVDDTQQFGDYFAMALTAGDFDGDGFADLAVGVPYEDTGSTTNNGAVNILFGSATGLSGTGSQFLYQGHDGVIGTAEDNDQLGRSLASGDFNGDGRSDLAIGIPYEDDGAIGNGAVVVLYGTSTGLTGTGSKFLRQGYAGLLGTPADADNFGWSLAAGDFDGDQRDDLAIGVPHETVGGDAEAGAVSVVYGSATGLTTVGNQLLSQDSPGIAGSTAEPGDHFGLALAAAQAKNLALNLPLIMQ